MLSSPPGRREYLLDTPQAESHYICGTISFMNLNRELPMIGYCIAKHCIVIPCGHRDISVQVTERRQAKVTRITSRRGKLFLDGQHQNTTSGMVPRILLPKIQPEEIKGFPRDFFFTSSQFGRQCLHVSSGTCAADKNSGFNF